MLLCGQEIISNSYLLPPRYRMVSSPDVRQKSCSKIHATIIPPISTSLRFGIPCEASLFKTRLDVQMFFRQLLFSIPLHSHFLQNSAWKEMTLWEKWNGWISERTVQFQYLCAVLRKSIDTQRSKQKCLFQRRHNRNSMSDSCNGCLDIPKARLLNTASKMFNCIIFYLRQKHSEAEVMGFQKCQTFHLNSLEN